MPAWIAPVVSGVAGLVGSIFGGNEREEKWQAYIDSIMEQWRRDKDATLRQNRGMLGSARQAVTGQNAALGLSPVKGLRQAESDAATRGNDSLEAMNSRYRGILGQAERARAMDDTEPNAFDWLSTGASTVGQYLADEELFDLMKKGQGSDGLEDMQFQDFSKVQRRKNPLEYGLQYPYIVK